MAIKNQAEMVASIATIDDGGLNTAAEMRAVLQDFLDSLQSYAGVIQDGQVDDINMTATPVKWTNYTMNTTGPNDVLEANYQNGQVKVFEPGLYFVTLRFFGQWGGGEDLEFDIRKNDVQSPSPSTTRFAVEGAGNNDPKAVSVTRIGFVVQTADIINQGDGNYATVSLWMASLTGTFNLDQLGVSLGVEYSPLSIRAVG